MARGIITKTSTNKASTSERGPTGGPPAPRGKGLIRSDPQPEPPHQGLLTRLWAGSKQLAEGLKRKFVPDSSDGHMVDLTDDARSAKRPRQRDDDEEERRFVPGSSDGHVVDLTDDARSAKRQRQRGEEEELAMRAFIESLCTGGEEGHDHLIPDYSKSRDAFGLEGLDGLRLEGEAIMQTVMAPSTDERRRAALKVSRLAVEGEGGKGGRPWRFDRYMAQELRATRSIRALGPHKNIVTIERVGVVEYTGLLPIRDDPHEGLDDGHRRRFLAGLTLMPYIGHNSFYNLMAKSKQASVQAVALFDPALVLDGLLSALSFLHSHNFIHDDIKPDNLLLGPEGQLVLCDFGHAVHVSEADDTDRISGPLLYYTPVERLSLMDGMGRFLGPSTASDVWSAALCWADLVRGKDQSFFDVYDSITTTTEGGASMTAEEEEMVLQEETLMRVREWLSGSTEDRCASLAVWMEGGGHGSRRVRGEVVRLLVCMLSEDPKSRPSAYQAMGRLRRCKASHGVFHPDEEGPGKG